MIAEKFKKLYTPYFFDTSLKSIPVENATIDQARSCYLLSNFDYSVVEDIALLDLVEKHILELPKNFTFVTIGPEADPLDRYFRIIIPKYRSDISFIKPDLDIDPAWVGLSTEKYFASHPAIVHSLATMDRLIKQGIPCGRIGPFIRGRLMMNKWLIQANYATVPFHLFGLEHSSMVVPNFTLPFAKAFLKDLGLPNATLSLKIFGPVVLMNSIMKKITGPISLNQHIEDGDDWNWYPNLINRNWPGTRFDYYSLEKFL